MIYTPSFSNLASMPSLVTSASAQKSAGVKPTPVGAIVGGAVVGLLALVFIPLLVLWLRRRKAKKNLASPFDLSKPEGRSLIHCPAFLEDFFSLNSAS
jgi:hypothetical protein